MVLPVPRGAPRCRRADRPTKPAVQPNLKLTDRFVGVRTRHPLPLCDHFPDTPTPIRSPIPTRSLTPSPTRSQSTREPTCACRAGPIVVLASPLQMHRQRAVSTLADGCRCSSLPASHLTRQRTAAELRPLTEPSLADTRAELQWPRAGADCWIAPPTCSDRRQEIRCRYICSCDRTLYLHFQATCRFAVPRQRPPARPCD